MRIPLANPMLPKLGALEKWISQIDGNRFYSNGGPLIRRLRAELTGHFDLASEKQISMMNNATTALILALHQIKKSPTGKCLMPSWSFAATGQAAIWAGLDPYFADVDPATGMLDIAQCEAAVQTLGVDAIAALMVVSYLGSPIDLGPWVEFRARTGIPVLVDAAAGFDSFRLSPLPTVISMHATKIFCTGEGGCVLSDDEDLIARLDSMINFGFDADRNIGLPGMNGKMSEYNAAIGLAFWEMWPTFREEVRSRLCYYNEQIARHTSAEPLKGMGDEWVASMYAVHLKNQTVKEAKARLADCEVDSKSWWDAGMHRKTLFTACGHGPLTETEALASRSIGLPFFADITEAQMDHICRSLEGSSAAALHLAG